MNDPTTNIPRCTVQRRRGDFCDSPSMAGAPFPICSHHALSLFKHMAQDLEAEAANPIRRLEATLAWLDAARSTSSPGNGTDVEQVYYLMIDGLVKIGMTADLNRRLGQYPPTAQLLAVEPGGRKVEAQRHQQFAQYRTAGREWFTPGPELRQHIESLPTYRAA